MSLEPEQLSETLGSIATPAAALAFEAPVVLGVSRSRCPHDRKRESQRVFAKRDANGRNESADAADASTAQERRAAHP